MYWFGLEHVVLDAGQMGGKGAECTPWIYKYSPDVKFEFEVATLNYANQSLL